MSSFTSFREDANGLHRSDDGVLRDFRQRLADEQLERAEKKRIQLADQRSDFNDPKERIRAWERAHGLRLPTNPAHPVLAVVAAATSLTLEQVLEEQRQRAAPVAAKG